MASTLKVQNIAHTGGTTGLTIASDGTLLAQDKIVHWKICPDSSPNVPGSWSQITLDHTIFDSHSLKSGNNIVITNCWSLSLNWTYKW